ncbi:histone H1 [Sphingobacterium mizutaii]|uniref:histone H1 n=1 Tax=Sphingobacterium mizutaii TaxID=1010 RepID=UPI00289A14FE|nr:histone H1 [Sphingobacterium mizutaii]
MDKFTQIKELIANAESDYDKFTQKGNGAAGTRLRGSLLQIGRLTKEYRAEIAAKKKADKEAE